MTERRRNLFVLLFVAGLLVASAVVVLSKSTKQGLDLKGGVELVYQAKPTKFAKVDGDSIERSLDIMRERVDQLGVAEPEIQRSGSDQIVVSLPDVQNQARAIDQVGTTAQLYFYDWETNVLGPDCRPDPTNDAVHGGDAAGDPSVGLEKYGAVIRASRCPAKPRQNTSKDAPVFYLVDDKAKKVLSGPEEQREDLFEQLRYKRPRPGQSIREVKPGTVIVQAERVEGAKEDSDKWFVLNDDFALRGTDVKNPEQNFDQSGSGGPIVTFEFTDKGRRTWQQVTREIAERGQGSFPPKNQHFAVVLDDDLITVPFIDFKQNPDGIDGRNGSQIEGGFTIQTAQDLANQLKTGALPIRLELISASQVSATLGQEALDQGLVAGISGFVIVVLFLLAFYRVLGVIAVVGLFVYAVYFYALIKLIPITLTLPGIAGLILTLGVAADANIVIFERVKEEIRGGRSVMAGIAQGYKKGIAAIIDANVVTFMVAFILFILSTAGVKGFAFVLGIGTIVSLFTAVLATQAVLGTMGRSRLIAAPSALGAAKPSKMPRIDYMGLSKYFFSASGIILLVGAFAIATKGIEFGIDFKSGTRITAAFEERVDVERVRGVMSGVGFPDAKIQAVSNRELGDNAFQVSTPALNAAELDRVKSALDDQLGFARSEDQTVGPTFGRTVANSAIIAIIASLLVISAYIALRFEAKFSVPVLIALTHDILIVSGVYAFSGREVTTSTVAALLTILGYSLYDTIIVFDRVRENLPRMPRAAFSQIFNRSMDETIVRSLATTFSTTLPVLALLLFGGETLKDFAFALLIGIASSTYSSIFIASPVLTHWKEREGAYRSRRARIAAANGGVVPAYATAAGGAAMEVAPKDRPRKGSRLTAPEDPERRVSAGEFQEMVRELHADAPVATAPPEPVDTSRDLSPEDVVMPDQPRRDKPRKPRNKRHGRSR